MVLSEVYSVVKICRELCDWMDAEEAKMNADLEEVQEIDIMEARRKIKKLKKVLSSID